MKNLCSISVPSVWHNTVDSETNNKLLKENKEKEQDIRNCMLQDYVLFNTHTTVVNGIMYVTYIFTKQEQTMTTEGLIKYVLCVVITLVIFLIVNKED